MADTRAHPHSLRSLLELHGHGLHLSPWDPASRSDAEVWLRGTTDPEFNRWNTPLRPVTDVAGAREALRRRAQWTEDGTTVSFRIADADTGTPLGHIGVNDVRPVQGLGMVGYWVLPEARRRGVATRALLLAARWAFTELGLHRLELDHAVEHEVSCRIAERCGFLPEGVLREAMFAEGSHDAFRDSHLHARLATDPEPAPPKGC